MKTAGLWVTSSQEFGTRVAPRTPISLQLSSSGNANAIEVHEGPFPRLSTQGTDTGIANGSNLPATNFAAFHKEVSTDNNSLQSPKPRRTLSDLKAWPHKGSVTTSLLSAGFPAQEIADCVELLGSLRSCQRKQSSSLKNKKVQTGKLLGLHVTSQHRCCE